MAGLLSRLIAVYSPRPGPFPGRGVAVFVLPVLAALLLGVASAGLYIGLSNRPPGEGSAEAGFARDMAVHHAQAVEMAEIVQRRTDSEKIRLLATDMMLTQQGQIGQMQGWLAAWGLPQTGTEPPMAWMGHPTEGRMPGMASAEEVRKLEVLPPDEADEQFLQLMIPHHRAAIPMAQAVLEETDRPEVEQLASAIAASQEGEIRMMQDMLRSRGASPAAAEPTTEAEPEHGPHAAQGEAVGLGEAAAAVAHGAAQGASAFLVGLVAFVPLVWLPTSRAEGVEGEEVVAPLRRMMWLLVGLLVVAGLVELSVYTVRASGESLSPGLVWQALVDTRVGHLWIARVGFGVATAFVATRYAFRNRNPAYWWAAAFAAGVLLLTLTQQSHAAAEGRLLPFVSDWLHVAAASAWMGGLLGFPMLLLGPLHAVPPEARARLLGRTVRRFSKLASVAVVALLATGLYASLLHVPSFSALIDTPYGRALFVKLGLMVFLLAAGGMNLLDRGENEAFGRVVGLELALVLLVFVATGFLTTLPPPGAEG
jgi:uncharacterized protein (DUF305 family)/putative copper export protein